MATTQDRKGNSTVNEIEKNRVNRKLDSKEKIVIKALTEKNASLKLQIRELQESSDQVARRNLIDENNHLKQRIRELEAKLKD